MLTALYHGRRLDQLSEEFAVLLHGMQRAVQGMLAEIDQRQTEPMLGWSHQSGPLEDRSVADTLRYDSGQYGFEGRDAEFDFLTRFLGEISADGPLARFRWLLITGPGGEGKSCLAFELSVHAQRELGWYAGRLTLDAMSKFDGRGWNPRRPTCIVIDYPSQAPASVRALLAALQERSADFDWPVRVLLLERDTQEKWFKTVFPEDSTTSAIQSHVHRLDGHRLVDGWQLPPLPPLAIVSVMRERIRRAGVEPPGNERLIEAACRIDHRIGDDDEGRLLPIPRPLFAMAAAEMLILQRRAASKHVRACMKARMSACLLTVTCQRYNAALQQPPGVFECSVLYRTDVRQLW